MDQKPFVFSVKAVVANPAGEYLLIRRSRQSKNNAGRWDLPGGKCGPGESIEAALRREVAEETGLDVRVTRVVGAAQADLPDRVVAYLLLAAQADRSDVHLSEEHDDHRWVSRKELATTSVPKQFSEFLKQFAASKEPAEAVFKKDVYGQHIETFRGVRPTYGKLAAALIKVLQQAADRLGIHPIIQARAKTLPSFAEKIVRKNYADPFRQTTDLCGARVIAHTLHEVVAVCRFVEENFQVFPEDSGDKLDSLAAAEFGYLSRHYVIAFKPGVFPEVPPELVKPEIKAELQVRTILQHAWADINHELSYKNRFRLPRLWQREFARLAAVLEQADRDFDTVRVGLDEYASSYGAYYAKERLQEEIEKQTIILEASREEPTDPATGNVDVAMQLAKMAISLEDWDRAVQVLQPFAEKGPAALLRDLGMSMCKLHGKAPHGTDFVQGQEFLKRATELDPGDVDAWASLGGTWRKRANASEKDQRSEFHEKARQCYRGGYEKDPSHPYPLGNYIEYEIAARPELDIASYFRPALEAATRRCRLQAEVNVNLPWVYFDLGKFQLLLRQPYAALGHYAAGVAHSSAAFFLDSALASFDTLQAAQPILPGFDWSRDFLRLAQAVRFGKASSIPSMDSPRFSGPVLILSGYCGRPADPEHRTLLLSVLAGFRGTIISGGTEAGISSIAGEFQAANAATVQTLGYMPKDLPADVKLDKRYCKHRQTTGTDFSPLEPLQYWTDLSGAGVPMQQVKLLAIGGGNITACECQMALALGVPVAVVEAADSEAWKSLADHPWSANPLLQRLPADFGVLRTFLTFSAK